MASEDPMVQLYSPESESQLLVLRSVFEDARIPYFVHNDAFGSLLAGPRIAHLNRKMILVHRADLDEARALLGEFLEKTTSGRDAERASRYSLRDKLRMVLEFLIFGWFLPGRRQPRPPTLRVVHGYRSRQSGCRGSESDTRSD
ncbi:MAG: DUF2007 domain-containing protein [Thermoanaerobaculia bacterium]